MPSGKTLKDVETEYNAQKSQHPWANNNLIPWMRSLRKDALDNEIIQRMRSRNNAPDMTLPKKFTRSKEEITMATVPVELPEVALQGDLAPALTAQMVPTKDNREVIHIECTVDVLEWLRVAAKSCCPDPDEESPLKRTRRGPSDRLDIPAELRHVVRFVRYDRKNIVCKFTNGDGSECSHTVRPPTWDEDGVAEALGSFIEWRKPYHYVMADGVYTLATGAPSQDAQIDEAPEDGNVEDTV